LAWRRTPGGCGRVLAVYPPIRGFPLLYYARCCRRVPVLDSVEDRTEGLDATLTGKPLVLLGPLLPLLNLPPLRGVEPLLLHFLIGLVRERLCRRRPLVVGPLKGLGHRQGAKEPVGRRLPPPGVVSPDEGRLLQAGQRLPPVAAPRRIGRPLPERTQPVTGDRLRGAHPRPPRRLVPGGHKLLGGRRGGAGGGRSLSLRIGPGCHPLLSRGRGRGAVCPLRPVSCRGWPLRRRAVLAPLLVRSMSRGGWRRGCRRSRPRRSRSSPLLLLLFLRLFLFLLVWHTVGGTVPDTVPHTVPGHLVESLQEVAILGQRRPKCLYRL